MNDLDLRAALHRDADLVGEPSPDLLDQLSRRRQHQRRAGVMAATMGVVVIGASIPVAQSFMTQSHVGPAVETTVDPTPSMTPEPTPVVPEVTPTPSVPTGTAVVDNPPVPDVVAPGCPDQATLLTIRATHSPDTSADLYTNSMATLCSGEWAFTAFNHVGVGEDGLPFGNAMPQLYQFAGGTWTPVDRFERCKAGEIPDDIFEMVCNSG